LKNAELSKTYSYLAGVGGGEFSLPGSLALSVGETSKNSGSILSHFAPIELEQNPNDMY
jgi:hypothetical protein